MKLDTNSLAHTKWNCKYHIVFGSYQVFVGNFFENANSALVFSPNSELEAVDSIGVGRVMIKAMRYWATAIRIVKTWAPFGLCTVT